MNRWLLYTLLGWGTLSLMACGPVAEQTEEASGTAEATAEEAAVSLEVVDLEGYQQALRTHAGKVILVDFWATWCVPCKEHYPETLRWAEEHADAGLVVFSMSLDEESEADKALGFLKKVNSTIPNFRSQYGSGTSSAEQFDLVDAVPYYKLYDRTGKLRYQFSVNSDVVQTTEPLANIPQRITELLAEGVPGEQAASEEAGEAGR